VVGGEGVRDRGKKPKGEAQRFRTPPVKENPARETREIRGYRELVVKRIGGKKRKPEQDIKSAISETFRGKDPWPSQRKGRGADFYLKRKKGKQTPRQISQRGI